MTQKKIIRQIVESVFRCAPAAVVATLICYIGTAAAVSAAAGVLAELFDAAYAAASGGMRAVIALAAAYMGLQILQKVLNVISEISWNVGVDEKCRYAFRMKLQEKAAALRLIEFEDSRRLDQLQRARECVEASILSDGFYNIMILGECVSIIVGLMAVLCGYSLWYLPILLITISPYLISRLRMGKEFYQLRWFQASRIRKRDYLYSIFAGKNSQREQRIFRFGDYIREKWERERDRTADETNAFRRKDSGRLARCELLITTGYLLGILLSVLLVIRGEIAVGVFGAGIFAFQRVQSEAKAFFSLLAASFGEILDAGDYFEFLTLEEEPKRTGRFDGLRKGIEVRNLSFTYPNADRPAVEVDHLFLHAGESVVIVGENGSGKTTFGKLLIGLYTPQSGEIRYDGQPLEEISREDLTRQISAVSQSFVEYHLTIRESLGIHAPEQSKDDAKISQALTEAGLLELADPAGYDQWLGREFGGRELSGGQWQKLAIAGAALKPHSMMILDEPTSALDPSSEYEILSRFVRMMEGKTSLVISHRVGLCRLADRVIFLKEGRVAGSGTHQELWAGKKEYRSFYQEQAQWYEGKMPLPSPAHG